MTDASADAILANLDTIESYYHPPTYRAGVETDMQWVCARLRDAHEIIDELREQLRNAGFPPR